MANEIRPPGPALDKTLNDMEWSDKVAATDDPNGTPWANVNKTGSDLADLATKNHSSLDNIGTVDASSADTVKDKHVSNNDLKTINDNHTAHTGAESAHGSNGDVVGKSDLATTALAGLVKEAALIADAAAATAGSLTDSTTGTASQTINDVTASFSQTVLNNNFASLTDEINKLITDVADIRSQLNALLAGQKTAGQMSST